MSTLIGDGVAGRIATLPLNRPEACNAIYAGRAEALRAARRRPGRTTGFGP